MKFASIVGLYLNHSSAYSHNLLPVVVGMLAEALDAAIHSLAFGQPIHPKKYSVNFES